MNRDVAIRIDGMLMATQGELNAIVYYMKENLSQEQYFKFRHSIGESMAALIDISTALHNEFPDIVPKELRPDE